MRVQVDIWAAGVTLYYMVEFNPPFQGSTLAELYINIGKGEFRCASDQGGVGKWRRYPCGVNPHQGYARPRRG